MSPREPAGHPPHPEAPATPAQAGSDPHSPGEGDASRRAPPSFWEDITHRVERIKTRRKIPLGQALPTYRHPWEHPGCRDCDHGMVDTGRGWLPCPTCRAGRQ